MITEIISGCGCCGTIVGRISLCDLQNIFIKLYTQAKSVAISRNLGEYPSTYVRINIDNTGSISVGAWEPGSLAAFTSWVQINYPNTQGNITTKSLTNYIYNMEDWIYDSYKTILDLQPPNSSILIIINTMDSSVHYSSDYSGYPFTTAGTDRPTPVITNNLQLYEYDCDLYNNTVNQTPAIIAMGDIIGSGGSYSLAQKTNQIKNTGSNKWPINTGGFPATAWAGGVSCDTTIADLEERGWIIRSFYAGHEYLLSDRPSLCRQGGFSSVVSYTLPGGIGTKILTVRPDTPKLSELRYFNAGYNYITNKGGARIELNDADCPIYLDFGNEGG